MAFTNVHRFEDWPNPNIPLVAAGVYAIWNGSRLIYVGMSGRKIDEAGTKRKKRYGLITRLNSHASGRLGGDQFCVYVAERLVIPRLNKNVLKQLADGSLTLTQLTKRYIHDNLTYQYQTVKTSQAAYELEKQGRCGNTFKQKPLLNPAG